jgi:hypothetical protein
MDGDVKPKAAKVAKEEAAFLQEARERFEDAAAADRDNRLAAEDDLDFFVGNQWDDTVKATRTGLGRPCLTINRLPQFVAQVVGDIRINKPAIKVRPAEDGDEDIANVRQGLIRAIEHDCGAADVYANAAQSQVACGIGNFRVVLDYASDEVFEQNIVIKAIPNPFSVVWDPLAFEPTGKDARYCFIVDEMSRKDFEAAWPDAQSSDLTVDQAGWSTTDTVRVTEYWVMKETPALLAMTEGGRTVRAKKSGEGYTDEAGMPVAVAVSRRGEPLVRKSKVRSACRYLITGNAVLEGPYELPISRLPVFRVQGWEVTVKSRRVRWGLVRFAKDPQRLMNYWRSVSAELLAMAPKAQWIAPGATVEGREQDFRDAHRSGDPLLIYNDSQQPPQRVDPPAFPAAVLQEAQLNAQDMKDVTGLHDASLGAQSNETSGRAILARDRQGDVATFIYPDNLKSTIAECGRVTNELIPLVYDTARTVRVLGEDESVNLQRINDPTDPEALDIANGRYDVVVDTGPSYTTRRVEAAETMMEFLRTFPQAAPFIGDLYVKAQDWPLGEEIGDRLKKMLPPQLQEPKEGEAQTPSDPAQIMQAKASELELQKAEAEVQKARADAVKAEAEAAQAEFEAERQSYGVAVLRNHGPEIAARFAEMVKEPPLVPGHAGAAASQPQGIGPASAEPSGQAASPPPDAPATGEGEGGL